MNIDDRKCRVTNPHITARESIDIRYKKSYNNAVK